MFDFMTHSNQNSLQLYPGKKVLIIEDDQDLGTMLANTLELQQYNVRYLTSGIKALNEVNIFQPDIILLDVLLGEDLNGFQISRIIRKTNQVPVIFATGCSGNDDIIQAFNIGNSDYIFKPYRIIEILVRISNLLSKNESHKSAIYQSEIHTFDYENQILISGSNQKRLNHYESEVLKLLCENSGTFIERGHIIKRIWKVADVKSKEASLNNVLSLLRRYLQNDMNICIESKIHYGVRIRRFKN